MRSYLFISGCARSGTSALTMLLGSHPKVCLGMERYGHIACPSHFSLTPQHFTPDRFLNVREGDTFYQDFSDFHKWCPDISEKIHTCSYVGDKRPDYYNVFERLRDVFQPLKLIHIIRNLRDVASSWEKRANITRDWPKSKDFQAALRAWNTANSATLQAVRKGYPILVVEYEKIFSSDANNQLSRILSFLELEWHAESRSRAVKITLANSQRVSALRQEFAISDEEFALIQPKAKYEIYEELQAKAAG